MNTLFLAANGGMQSNNVMMIILFIILIGFTYFGMIRPQKKQQQKRMEMMDQLKKGDRVVLVDGLHAKIDSINSKDQTVVVDADGIYLTFSRMAVRQIIPSSEATEEKTVVDTAKDVENKPEEKSEKSENPVSDKNKDTDNSKE
ncbi:preprotein translocase subunit YajC [Lactobacillus sp. LL6]|uniref:preprotein translocase subunit YajC n=1 Tax=Lactobacillus sp. LL6 TaxID=2596827 RepID=UPI001642E970|nr:preprotein translocase subunit YajC [Lactobacillus sp. LL6]